MKIAICVHNLTGGGAERVASLWAKGFHQRGNQVCMVLAEDNAPITYRVPEAVKLYSIDVNCGNRILDFIRRKILQPQKLYKIFKEFNPDIVIAVFPDWGPLIVKSRRSLRFKTIGTDHNAYEYPANVPMPKYLWKQKYVTNKLFDHVTVLTQADLDFIGNRLPHVSVLPNPLVFKQIDHAPKRLKRVLAVGRLDGWFVKGFDLLIEAFGRVSPSFIDWELCIMGKGSDNNVKMLSDLAKKNGIESKFRIIPYQDDPTLEYIKSEVFCLSSRYEGFGMVLIEAMSQGCACITCDFKGRQKEIINDDRYGLVCNAGNVDALEEAMRKMLSDERYRKEVGIAAIERSRTFDLDRIMDRWDEIIQNVFNQK